MKTLLRVVIAMLVAGSAAILILLYLGRHERIEPPTKTDSPDVIMLPDAAGFPMTASTPSGLWLAERLARGLYRRERDGTLTSDLADGPPIYTLTLFLKPQGIVRLPSTDRLTAKNIENYFLPMKSIANSPVGAVRKIDQAEGEIRIAIDPQSGFGDDEILDLLNIRRGDAAVAIRTEFAVTIRIRKDLQRNNEGRLTAREIVAPLEALRAAGENSPLAFRFQRVREIRAIDDETIIIVCDGVSRNALSLLTTPMFPEPRRSTISHDAGNRLVDVTTGLSATIVASYRSKHSGERPIPGKQTKIALIFNLRVPQLNKEGLRRRMHLAATGAPVKGIPPFRLRLLVDGDNDVERAAAEEVARRWKDCGIEVETLALDGGEVAARVSGRQFEVCVRSIPSDRIDLYACFHSSQSLRGWNYSGYSSAETDRLLEKLDKTFGRATADILEGGIMEHIREDLPWIILDGERPLAIRARGNGLAILDALIKN